MKKILVSDYDDTFYINDEDVLENVRSLNENYDKFMFIIATGRSYYDYDKKRKLYNIKSEYLIINHGASILKDDKLIYNVSIDEAIKNELISDLEINNCQEYFACSGLESRVDINTKNLTKIHIKYNTLEKTMKILEIISKKYGKYINSFLVSNNYAIEIVSSNVDKKNAILKILELEGIKEENVYTIGNGATDYEMLNFFNGYAMENSSSKIEELNLEKIKSVSNLIERLSK